MDEELWLEAKAEADRRFPTPKQTPANAAFKGGLVAFSICIALVLAEGLFPTMWAVGVVVAVTALIGWVDTRNEYRANAREAQELFEIYSQRKRSDGSERP